LFSLEENEMQICRFAIPVLLLLATLQIQARPAHADEPKSKDLRLLNTCIFRQSVDKPIKPLLPGAPWQIEPLSVQLDIKDGKYYAATVVYPKTLTFSEARIAMNRVYGTHEVKEFAKFPEMGLWRNEKDEFAFQLTEDDEYLRAIYITFQPLEVMHESLYKALLKLQDDVKDAR